MAKISKTHHVTKDGIVKRNPNRNPDPSYAGIILQQLGGNRFIAMTGANTFVKNPDQASIIFRIPKAKDSINYVRIILTEMDLYDMEFYMVRAGKFTLKQSYEGVYNDQLQDFFTEATGLYTRL